MQIVATGKLTRLGVWALFFIFLFTTIQEHEALAARRRRGRGLRRGAAARVRAGRRRGRRVVRRRGGRRGGLALNAAPVGGQVVGANGRILDAGPASINPASLGIVPIQGFNTLGIDRNGRVFELNPGAVQNGILVDPSTGVRQPLVGFNGQIVAGSLGQMLPGAAAEVRLFNQGELPGQPSGFGGVGVSQAPGVVSLRQR